MKPKNLSSPYANLYERIINEITPDFGKKPGPPREGSTLELKKISEFTREVLTVGPKILNFTKLVHIDKNIEEAMERIFLEKKSYYVYAKRFHLLQTKDEETLDLWLIHALKMQYALSLQEVLSAVCQILDEETNPKGTSFCQLNINLSFSLVIGFCPLFNKDGWERIFCIMLEKIVLEGMPKYYLLGLECSTTFNPLQYVLNPF